MAKLYFKVASDWEEVVRLRNEIAKLKQELKTMDGTASPAAFKTLNTQLSVSTQRMDELVTEAAKAGAVMEGSFKKKIFEASQTVNVLSEKMTLQRGTIQQLKNELSGLKDKYREALKQDGDTSSLEAKIKSTSAKLREQKDTLFNLIQEQANARLSVKKLRDEYSLYENDGKQVVETNQNIGLSLKKALGVIGGAAALKKLGSEIIRVRGEFQSMQTAIETMVGKNMAGQLIPQIKELAKISPLTMTDMVGAEKMMLGFNIQAEDTIKYLKALSDISMGESSKFNSLTLAFSQMSATGKLMGQDLNQMINAGFNPLQVIAEKTGKSIATLKDEMSKGAVSAEMVQQAFIDATSAGGKFYGMSENASKTINGQISMMQDAWENALNEIGQSSEGVIMSGIQATTSLIQNYEMIGKVLVGMIATYGVYKTALITNIALTEGWAAAARADSVAKGIQTIATKAQTVAQLALNSAMKVNPYVLTATLIVGVASAMWALHDSTSAVEKEMARVNERTETFTKYLENEKKHIESLISVLKDENVTKKDRIEAFNELQTKYPQYFSQYKTEKELIEHLTEALVGYNEQLRIRQERMVVKNNHDDIAQLNELRRLQELQNAGASGRTRQEQTEWINLYSKYKKISGKASLGISDIQGMISDLSKTVSAGQANIRKNEQTAWEATLETMNKTTAAGHKKMLEGYKILLRDSGKEWIKIQGSEAPINAEMLTNRIKQLDDKILNVEWKDAKTYRNEAKDAWEKAKKEVEDVKSSSTTYKSPADYQKALKAKIDAEIAAEKKYKDLGGLTSKQENEALKQQEAIRAQNDKLMSLESKQAIERQRQQQDLENQLAQSTIDALSDGYDKEKAQRDLNNKKEIQSLNRQKDDYIRAYVQAQKEIFDAGEELKAKKTKGYTKQTFDSSTINMDEIIAAWDKIIQNTETKQGVDEWQRREDAMNEYLIEYGTFAQKKEAIDKKYRAAIDKEVDLGKKNSLQKEWDEALTNLDLSKLKQEINWEMVFGDLSKVTKDQLTNIKKQLQEFKKSPEFQNATPEQIQVIESAINSINDAMVDKGGFFGGMVDSIKELKIATEELKKAEEELAEANKEGTEAEKEEAQRKVNKARQKEQNAETNVTRSSDKTIDNITKVGSAIAQLGSDAEMSLSSFGNAAANIVDAFTEAGSKIGGLIGAIFSILEGIQKQGLDGFVKNIIGNVAGAVGGVLDTLTFGAFGLSGADYSHYNDMVEEYTNLNKIWDELIDKKKEYIDMSYGAEANKVGKEALELVEKSIESYRIL